MLQGVLFLSKHTLGMQAQPGANTAKGVAVHYFRFGEQRQNALTNVRDGC